MRFIAKLILTIFFIPTLVILIFSSIIKFQLLETKFWDSSYQKQNTYLSLANEAKLRIGNKSDARVLTDLVTESNVKDFVTKNIDNFLNYFKGESREILVYIPINKLPKNLAPKSLALNSEEMPLLILLSKFNIQIPSNIPISQFSLIGKSIDYLLILTVVVILILLIFFYLITETEKRFISVSLSLLIVAICVFVFANKVLIYLTFNEKIINILTSPIIGEVIKSLNIISLVLFAIGLIIILFKKP